MKNSCIFTHFNIKKNFLTFDAIVTFDGIIPKTKKYVKYNNQIFSFEAEFSEPLEYDNLDVFQMIEYYIKQAKLSKCFEKIEINLNKTGESYDFTKGKNYLLFNSYGFDSYSIYLTLKDELKERMIEFSWVTDRNNSYLKNMIERSQHHRPPIVIYLKKRLENYDILFNPCNLTYLIFLLRKKFDIKLILYGDVSFACFQPHNVKNKNQLNIGYYQTELISMYISMLLGSKENFNRILFHNENSKIIRKIAYSKILTDYFGIKFEDYIDMNRFNTFKEKIKNKTFDYYFEQETPHSMLFAHNIYFFKEEFIKTLIDLFYSSERNIVEKKFKEFFKKHDCGHPLYNGDYFTISYKAFKQYMDNLGDSCKELEEIMYVKYKLLNLFNPNDYSQHLSLTKNSKYFLIIFPIIKNSIKTIKSLLKNRLKSLKYYYLIHRDKFQKEDSNSNTVL